jgi:hypothetical protein
MTRTISKGTILVLEDDFSRIERFQAVLNGLRTGVKMKVWRNANKMISEMEDYLQTCVLISLDHDLNTIEPDGLDPGDGLDLAKSLALHKPVCPVIVHSSNISRSEAMLGELELAGWEVKRIGPIGIDWIEIDWANFVSQLISR